jgi:alpha,alpha-trehalase
MYRTTLARVLSLPLLVAALALGTGGPAPAQPASAPAVARTADQDAAASGGNAPSEASRVVPTPPSERYGALFRDVELAHVFPDSKTFADMVPNSDPQQIVTTYQVERSSPGFDLRGFVAQHFSGPGRHESRYVSDPTQTVVAHIDSLWDVLRRDPDPLESRWSSLLPLPRPYVVPGGRFDEVYYWDSYFIMLGLEASGRHDLTRDELKNFATLIDRYGHIPNGNRTYYLSRSQPPFFAQMVQLVAERDGDQVYLDYLPELKAEYDYWMDGASTLKRGQAYRHVVRLSDGALLNRYWDDRATPRDESYREDVETAKALAGNRSARLWRNLRAGGETGWDFSSRWFADGAHLATIRVTSLLPVDLNALLYGLETTLARAYRARGDATQSERYEAAARARAQALHRVLWDRQIEAFSDYDFDKHTLTHRLTAATVYPLFVGMATRDEARAVAAAVERGLLRPGGMATTQVHTGQQWDEPNGWAPLQYLAVVGLGRYGQADLARTIATRWISTNVAYYVRTGKLVEKYDISEARTASSAGGGEYPLQDGFGWTNGVLRALLDRYPDAVDLRGATPAHAERAARASGQQEPRPEHTPE